MSSLLFTFKYNLPNDMYCVAVWVGVRVIIMGHMAGWGRMGLGGDGVGSLYTCELLTL